MVMTLQLPATIYEELLTHARAELPNESVGMLIGKDGLAFEYVPLINELQSPTRFLTEARSMLKAEKRRRHLECEVLAIVHSHPTSEPVPSRYDVADHYSSEVMCMIVSLRDAEPLAQAWWIANSEVSEGKWEMLPD
jgi:proteasome lid subunit RPN8/RPN11